MAVDDALTDGLPSQHLTTASGIFFLNGSSEVQTTASIAVTLHSWRAALIVASCGLLIVGTIVGNILVVTAVAIVRKLRTPSNLLIVSLAVSDLLVAGLVMPLAAFYEAVEFWPLGEVLCDMWTSLDVMLCTASILNLCAISVDRYLVISRPLQYAMKRSRVHMALMIAVVWSLSAVISIPPLFGWKAQYVEGICELSQAIGYQFYATIGAFYLPLAVMMFIYYRIYRVSSRIARSEAQSRPSSVRQREGSTAPTHYRSLPQASTDKRDDVDDDDPGLGGARPTAAAAVQNGRATHSSSNGGGGGGGGGGGEESMDMLPKKPPRTRSTIRRLARSRPSFKTSVRERKATRTLGVIMGAFTACWLPFFIVALVKPFHRGIPDWLSSLLLWLGYANSFLNPIIYARFNRDFRGPFRDILLFRCSGINNRQRSESYAEQYGTGSIRDSCRPAATTTAV